MVEFNAAEQSFGLDKSEASFIRGGLEHQLGYAARIPDSFDTSDPRQEAYKLLRDQLREQVDDALYSKVPNIKGLVWLPNRLASIVCGAVEPSNEVNRLTYEEIIKQTPNPNRGQQIVRASINPEKLRTLGERITSQLASLG